MLQNSNAIRLQLEKNKERKNVFISHPTNFHMLTLYVDRHGRSVCSVCRRTVWLPLLGNKTTIGNRI